MLFAVNSILFSSEHHGHSVVFLHTCFMCSKKGGIPAIPAAVSGEKDRGGIFYRLEFFRDSKRKNPRNPTLKFISKEVM